jgi:hypothetical protein
MPPSTQSTCGSLSGTVSNKYRLGVIGFAMTSPAPGTCRRAGCANAVPDALANERICLDHFLDDAFVRTDQTFNRCRDGRSMNSADVEWLLSDALAIVKNLEEKASDPQPQQRDRMLELLLMLANLHEYVAHHSIRLDQPA